MKTRYLTSLAILAGFGMGALAVQGLHAQAQKTVLYSVTEIDVKNLDAYLKEYAPPVTALQKKFNGRNLTVGGKVTPIEGQTPKSRVAIIVWDNMAQYQAYRNSAEWKESRKIGDKYATFRTFAVEGAPQ